ncbi:AI-2E family transporter [Siculibacillus lacustris]|uniref:AI-2E family transporter n=1 Tax=Siculibacillus lacustris TaxID=1549641 RepID=A0A4Q9VVT2_9HYPH|nr:AI-2E family transporter [Siculibacillus lacustris]TBW40386.1 AI-2E family transporter [Siculibacillus lacustris]
MNRPVSDPAVVARAGLPDPTLLPPPSPAASSLLDPTRSLAEWAVIGLFVIAAFAVMRSTAGLLVPMVAAVVVGSVLARIGDRAARLGIAPLVAGLGLVGMTGLGGFLLVDALLEPFAAMVARAPQMLASLTEAAAPLMAPLSSLKKALMHVAGDQAAAPVAMGSEMSWLGDFVSGLTPALGEFFVFFATLAFFVAGRVALRRRMILVWTERERRLAAIRILNAIEEALALYFATTATIYAGVGVATAVIAAASGLANPILWGMLAFTASFIPYLGAGLIALALAAGGLVGHPGSVWAMVPAGAFLIVHLVSENAVIPAFLGRRLEINPFVVFVAIVFWSWMWGPVGAMLAVPLLLVADTIHDELRPSRGALPA